MHVCTVDHEISYSLFCFLTTWLCLLTESAQLGTALPTNTCRLHGTVTPRSDGGVTRATCGREGDLYTSLKHE